MSEYTERDNLLLKLGFKNYDKYLSSAMWRDIKKRAYKEHGKQCKVCGDDATVLHHKNYSWEIMSGKNVKSLVPLCHDCHFAIEFSGKCKRTLTQTNKFLARFINVGEKPEAPEHKPRGKRKIPCCPSILTNAQRGYKIPVTHRYKGRQRILICSECKHQYASKYLVKYASCQKCGARQPILQTQLKAKMKKTRRKKYAKKKTEPMPIEQRKTIMANLIANPRF